ncbi:MAG: DeoR family transcriptional regulator [Candidatus Bathyarchaeia archaeon]
MSYHKKASFKYRIEQIKELLAKKQEITVDDVVKALEVSPTYARYLLRTAPVMLEGTTFDDLKGILKRKVSSK